jgi:pimeloyl-ACP methyl ester carboxylesterase
MRRAEPATEALIDSMIRLCEVGGTRPASRTATVNDRTLHYLEVGDPASPTLVLVHGASGGGANWYGVFKTLSAHFHILAPDLPGFGLSDPMPLEPPIGTQTAHTLAAWLDAIGHTSRVHIAGTSFGGLAALRFAQHYPARTARLVLVDSAGAGAEVHRVVRLANSWIGGWLLRPSRSGTRLLLRNVLTKRRMPESEQEALVEYLYLSGVRTTAKALGEAIRAFSRDPSGTSRGQAERPTGEELSRVSAETLIVWGAEDAFFPPSHATVLADRMPNAVRLLIDGAGHSPNWDRPEALAAHIITHLKD